MKKQVSLTEYKIFLILVKYIPFITTVILVIHIASVLCNNRLIITEILAGCSILPAIMIYSLARVLRYCWAYHSLLWYTVIIGDLIIVNRYYQIEHLQELGYITLMIGIFLIVYSIIFKCIWKKQPMYRVDTNQ